MNQDQVRALLHSESFKQLVAKKQRLGWSLTAIMLVIFFGYLFLVSTRPDLLSRSLSGGVTTVGIPLGISVIISAIVLAGIYVWKANGVFDSLTQKVIEEHKNAKQ